MERVELGTLEMDVILYPEDGRWIAQGLQFDITASGVSPVEASERFDQKVGAELVMSFEVGDEQPLAGVGHAPQKFWTMFREAKLTVEKETLSLRISAAGRVPRVRSRMKLTDERALVAA